MHGRRLAGLTLAASLLHLNFVRADAACSGHEQTAPSAATHHDGHTVPHQEVASTAGSSSAPADHDSSCDMPVQVDCCEALASCASGAEATAMFIVASGVSRDAAIGFPDGVPRSRVTTPDPPPPKA